MNIAKEHKAMEAALDNYRAQLDAIPDELFSVTPPGGGWSFAEVYAHILKATLGASIGLEKCTQKNCEKTAKGLSFVGSLMMFSGRFPPFRVKVPQAIADKMPAEKITKEDAKNLIIKCRKRIDITMPLVVGARPDAKTKHPRLGMLNAMQWFKFIRIHLEHHLNQLTRIKKKFK